MNTGGIVVADRGTASAVTASVARPVMLLTCNVPFDAVAVAVRAPVAPAAGLGASAETSAVNCDGDVPIRSARSVKPVGGVQVESARLAKTATSIVLGTVVVIDGAVAVGDAAGAGAPPEASIGLAVLTPLYAWMAPAARRDPENVHVHDSGSDAVATRQ